MPKRDDLKTILIIGSGPIVIGQACEFDYSGTQACKALKEEGYQIVLVNSNPATIMTDPELADRTYIEPITAEAVAKIIAREESGKYHIDALLPTLGGQTALNTACQLYDDGTLERFGVEMIGATREVIYRAEDRDQFIQTIESIGLKCPRSGIANSMDEAWHVLDGTAGATLAVGLPAIIRPAFTLGGTGSGIAYDRAQFENIVQGGLAASMTSQILIDQSLIGWKEFELEVMRDREDNVVIVCSIENLDPMGVHTGDSITVAPAQTLTDKEYQRMRDGAIAIIRAIGVETGGSNIQFAVNPQTGEQVVIEMNPRVSRSSALASKATGFPIAKIAAKLAVGHTLWNLPNDITGKTVACFEPTIDYVVTKIPRWTFEKFPEADETLTTQMKSVGEAMSIGRTFKESFQKGIRSMEVKRFGYGLDESDKWLAAMRATVAWLADHHPERLDEARTIIGGALGGCTALQAAAVLHGDVTLTSAMDEPARLSLAHLRSALAVLAGSLLCNEADRHPPSGEGAQTNPVGLVDNDWPIASDKLHRKLSVPCQGRIYYIRYAFKMGWSLEQVFETTRIDPWFLDQLKQIIDFELRLIEYEALEQVPAELLREAKQLGYSDAQLACLYRGKIHAETILDVRGHRKAAGIEPVYKLVDTCAAEFEAATPYYYSTYESPYRQGASGQERVDDEIRVSDRKKIIILGGGPNRIGQGIEFDYCCVQAAFAASELDFESVMVNSNPETVSTDYDTSDLLFFEPLTLEDVLNICERLNGRPLSAAAKSTSGSETAPAGPDRLHGVIVQFGGQTPLNLAHGLRAAHVPIIGTSVESIDLAEDRHRFADMCRRLNVQQPDHGIAYNVEQAIKVANNLGYPVLVRPSFVLGGRAMETVFDDVQLRRYMHLALGASDLPDQPILIDRFLSDAIECDVDVIADFAADNGDAATLRSSSGRQSPNPIAVVCGVMEHIEEAGVHSGDSACAIPPHSLPRGVVERIKDQSRRMAEALKVRGLMNVQFAIKRPTGSGDGDCDYQIFVLEVNPRASRTVPFVSKATGVSWARAAAKVMAGKGLRELRVTNEVAVQHTCVKESVFPFNKFPGVDVILGPEMRSTGEVMGMDPGFAIAFAKSQMAASSVLPIEGKVFLSVRDGDKANIVDTARRLVDNDFTLITTEGTARFLAERGIETKRVKKIREGHPNCADLIKNQELALIINTPTRKGLDSDEGTLRAMAVRFGVPYVTTSTAAAAAAQAMEALRRGEWDVQALQDYLA